MVVAFTSRLHGGGEKRSRREMPWPPLLTKQDQGKMASKGSGGHVKARGLCVGDWNSISWVLSKVEPASLA